MSRINTAKNSIKYVDRFFMVNAVAAIWNSEVRAYAWSRGQIHATVMHFVTWIGPVMSGFF